MAETEEAGRELVAMVGGATAEVKVVGETAMVEKAAAGEAYELSSWRSMKPELSASKKRKARLS